MVRGNGRPSSRRSWRQAAAAIAAALAVTALTVLPASGAQAATSPAAKPRVAADSHQSAARLTAAGHAGQARSGVTSKAGDQKRPTVVSLTFDDGDADQMAAARILRWHGMHGTFYIITGAIGTPNYLTLPKLRQLAADGNEIGGHTVSHLDMTRMPAGEAKRQACDSRNILNRWGFRVTSFAYPGGFQSPAVRSVVRDCGYDNARIATGLHSGVSPHGARVESIPPARPYAIRTPGQVDGTWTLADLKRLVNTAREHGGGWLPLVFHHVCSSQHCDATSARASLLADFTSWLARQRTAGVQVKTVMDVAGGPTKPLVRAKPAAPHGVVGGSLESQAASAGVDPTLEHPGVPGSFLRCWMPGGYGQNKQTWTRTRDARTGRWAMRLTVSRHHSGDAKLLQLFDLGACSLPVHPGHAYQLSTWYHANAKTQYSVYYRDWQGRWRYWTSSNFFQPANRWTKATWQIPPVPAGATGVSFGLALSSNGTLVTDDYGFQPVPDSVVRPILDWSLGGLAAVGIASWAVSRIRRRRRARANQPPPPPGNDDDHSGDGRLGAGNQSGSL